MGAVSNPDTVVLRCYALQRGDRAFACCLDLALADEAETLDAAVKKLQENITGYLELHARRGASVGSIRRPAPLRYYARYYQCMLHVLGDVLRYHFLAHARVFTASWDGHTPRFAGT